MNEDQIVVCLILIGTLVLFAWGRWRYDVVAAMALLAVVVTGLIPASQAFSGFGHPAVITVAAVLIISQALKNAGVVDYIVTRMAPLTARPLWHIFGLTAVVTVMSAFMNNVGALALMLPVALATAAEHKRSPAMLLMPLAFGSILGGMTTMIGTPPNVIIATFRAEVAGEGFAMFDFSPVGVVVALVGVAFVTLVGWRLIPAERRRGNTAQQLFSIEEYISEIRIPEDNALVGQRISEVEALESEDIDVIGMARGSGRAMNTAPDHLLGAGDILILRADPKALKGFIDASGVELLTSATPAFYELTEGDLTLAEGIVTPGSALEGRDVAYLRRRSGNTLAVVALARQGRPVRRRIRRQVFRAGDVLLVQGTDDSIDEQFSQLGLLPLARRELGLGQARRVGLAVLIFAVAIALGVAKVVPLTIAFLAAIIVYVIVAILPVRDLYREVDWPVLVLLGAMIPVGRALDTTGTTTLLANSVVEVAQGMPPWVILTFVLVVTMFLSDIINNAATALVMAPIAMAIAGSLGVSADAFLMAVAVGASCAFLTPIGHQSNTLVMGPGGYHFADYWRMGLPLEVFIVLVGVPMILVTWPL